MASTTIAFFGKQLPVLEHYQKLLAAILPPTRHLRRVWKKGHNVSDGKIGKEYGRHLRGEFFEHPYRPRDMSIA